jgi:hypothetical protein
MWPMGPAFDSWLERQMAAQRIRSATFLARAAGLSADHVTDWVLGRALPDDSECDLLANFLGVNADEVRAVRMPGR